MNENKKISTLEADKERLLEALRELRKDGVTLIDDRVGRPAVLPVTKQAGVVDSSIGQRKSTEDLLWKNLDRLIIEEPEGETDPYNKGTK